MRPWGLLGNICPSQSSSPDAVELDCESRGLRPAQRTTPVKSLSRHSALPVPLIFCLLMSCSRESSGAFHPIVVFGVDGLEWSVLRPLVASGELPAFQRLMNRGRFGKLSTLLPTVSPAIWTSVATGKVPAKHGIPNFVKSTAEASARAGRLYTNTDRSAKAVWNIFSDYELTTHTIGWWMTYPVEPVRGSMVSQTNTASQIKISYGRGVWKGSLVPGRRSQVYPPGDEARVFDLAEAVESELPQLLDETFGRFPNPPTELDRRLWDNTQWAFRADVIYERVAKQIVSRKEPFDVLMLYLGGPDVVGHRFWRYRDPEEFAHPPEEAQIENFGGVIDDYYRHVDRAIGSVLECLPSDATVFVLSDHGMVPINRDQRFDRADVPRDVNSGHHMLAPPGVLIASGRSIARGTGTIDGELPFIGSVVDLAPTLLALKQLPVGRDMDGRVLESLFEGGFLRDHPIRYVDSHDTDDWRASRPTVSVPKDIEAERQQQLRALGYID